MTPDPFRDVFILTGPTASGKTALALELAEASTAEIVAMDSMTLYRGMDVGTAKPTADERSRVPHHLIDVIDPWESASVAWWLERAGHACEEIRSRGRVPLFVGGTPLYLKAMLHGLFDAPPADEGVRDRLEAEAEADGTAALHARLTMVDPNAAGRLHPNDLRRVVRALEVWELTGRPISSWQTEWARDPKRTEPTGRLVVLDLPRAELHERINRRVGAMIEGGWLDEVRRLRTLPRPPGREASQAVGYRELGDHLDGRIGLDEAVERIRARTRQFAKRQMTWFRAMPGAVFSSPELTLDLWQSRII